MAANPHTDQYVQAMRAKRTADVKAPGTTDTDLIARLANELRAGLPDLDAAVIGEVALHTTVAIGSLYRQMLSLTGDALTAGNVAINAAGQAAERLYASEAGDL